MELRCIPFTPLTSGGILHTLSTSTLDKAPIEASTAASPLGSRLKSALLFTGAQCSFFIGAGIATGQESLQYFTAHGWWGIVSIVLVVLLFSWLLSSLTEWGRKNRDNKAEMEAREFELLDKYNIDFIVLARYMQVLSEDFINRYPNRIINIHHSFLPAFVGAKPYHAAYERGVKLIGATSHYVTTELDAGPIIEQDIVRITHKDTVADLVHKGRDLEKIVLSRAVEKHIQRKILAYKNKTIIFS